MIQDGQLIRDFRGFTAPASLKVHNGLRQRPSQWQFPGRNRPGLIEGGSRHPGGAHQE